MNPAAEVATVPVGIDPGLYPYIPDDRRTGEPVVSVIGNMGWYPTHSAAVRLLTRLWPEVKKRVPAARLQLVGWGARSALKDYLALPDVTVEENVPDTRPYFERTAVLLYAPGRGSGMKIKILEALGYGVPVVTRFRTYKLELERDSETYCETIMTLPAMQEWIAAARNEPMIIDKYEF